MKSPAQASRERRTFAKRIKFFEAKSVDSFNASDSRQPGEFFIDLGFELGSSPFLMPVSEVRLLAYLRDNLY